MTISLLLALTLIPAAIGFAEPIAPAARQAGPTATDDKPDPKLLGLEKDLAQEQEAKGPARATPEQYKEYVMKFRATLDETMTHVAPTAANETVHARILVRLGDSSQALTDPNAALEHDPKNPRLAAAKAYVLFDRKDFSASAAAANAILAKDPKNQDALWLKHASEDRNAPSLKLPDSPWGAGSDPQGGVAGRAFGVSNDASKPYTLAIKVGATPAPPDYVPPAGSDAPPEKRSPLVPLAATGVLLWVAASLAARQAQERGVEAVEQSGEAVADKAASLAARGKELIEDHPYASGAIAVAGILAGGLLAAPLVIGGGGPTLLAASSVGGSVPIAATAASVAPQAITTAGAATLALSVAGDTPEANSSDPKGEGGKLEKAQPNDSEPSKQPAKHKYSGKTVAEILRGKRGLIKQAPLEPGSPTWGEFSRMTWEEIEEGARARKSGFRMIRKLLTDGRFEKP